MLEPTKPARRRPSKEPRHPMPERDPKQRARDFESVGTGYDAQTARAEAERCLQCGKPQCQEGCPVNIDIKGFIAAILEDDFDKGISIIKERNWLPAVCGRVCPQENQCEGACILSKRGDAVAIGHLERFLADRDMERAPEERCITELAPPTGTKCAVVGSGPSSLAAAGELARLGHEVTIFEALHAPGGVLAYGIPEFRLPKKVLAAEIESLHALGVHIELNAVIGRTHTIEDLLEKKGFDAIFAGFGAGLPVFLGIPGENLSGVFAANEFLTRINLMRAYEFPANSDTPTWKGNRVVVLGGGNVAMDAARTALRMGADKVTIAYRRTQDEMPARKEEVHHALEEGVEILPLVGPLEIKGSSGFVTGLECIKMELGEADASGRRSPVPIPDTTHVIECDTIISAVGTRANPLSNVALPTADRTSRGYLETDESGMTSIEGVWAGGDIVTGAATVILAMGAGKKAAKAMDSWLRSK